jgi:hypothetical protein
MQHFTYNNTTFTVEATLQADACRYVFRDATKKRLEMVFFADKSIGLCCLKKSATCSGTFVFRMGLAFAKTQKQQFVMHVWDSAMVDQVDLGVLNLLRNKPTYYERLGFVHQDQAALQQAKRKAGILASQDMKHVLQACLDVQQNQHNQHNQHNQQNQHNQHNQHNQNVQLVDRVVRAVQRARYRTFGQFVTFARLDSIRDVFDVCDIVASTCSTTFFGMLFDLKRWKPSQLYLVVKA